METVESHQGNGSYADKARKALAEYKSGSIGDIEELAQAIWRAQYEHIPRLTCSKGVDDQKEMMIAYVLGLGIPKSQEINWLAAPILWFAREHNVLPPALVHRSNEPWELDRERYEALRGKLESGFVYYGGWLKESLQIVLAEQQ